MADYDYGNARLRAMKSRLLSRQELEALAGASSLQGLISALTKTAYRKAVETALGHCSGLDCVVETLRSDLVSTIGKVRTFYIGEAGEMAAIVLRAYDIHNLKAILRGLSRNASPGEILNSLLPFGDLKYDTLSELTRAPEPRGAIDLLASMNLPFAQPLLKLRALRRGAETFEMELALDKWHHQEAIQFLQQSSRSPEILISALHLEADMVNLLTMLRFVQFPSERKLLQEKLGMADLTVLLVGPGNLPFALLSHAGSQETPGAFVEDLAGTVYAPALKNGLKAYSLSGRLSEFEKQLRGFQLNWRSGLIRKDPLGIGVLLGYLTLKTTEISNLRWIAQGINAGMKSDDIRTELEFAR